MAPVLRNIRDSSVSVEVRLNERGVVMFAVVPRNTSAPTAAAVRSGDNYGDAVATGSGTVGLPFTKFTFASTATLTKETEYDVYIVGLDVKGNSMAYAFGPLPFSTSIGACRAACEPHTTTWVTGAASHSHTRV